jgi:hypothetical protein
MLGIHALTGIAEGAITTVSLGAIERLNPDFVFANGGGVGRTFRQPGAGAQTAAEQP